MPLFKQNSSYYNVMRKVSMGQEEINSIVREQERTQKNKTPSYRPEEINFISTNDGVNAIKVEYRTRIQDKERKKNVLNPEPPSFARPPPYMEKAKPFEPIGIYSKREQIKTGFPEVFPLVLLTRDIKMEDWKRFVEDICWVQSRVHGSRQQNELSNASALTQWDGGIALMEAESECGKENSRIAQNVVDVWNAKFFKSRGIQVVLQIADDIRAMGEHYTHKNNKSFTRKCYGKIIDGPSRLLIFDL